MNKIINSRIIIYIYILEINLENIKNIYKLKDFFNSFLVRGYLENPDKKYSKNIN